MLLLLLLELFVDGGVALLFLSKVLVLVSTLLLFELLSLGINIEELFLLSLLKISLSLLPLVAGENILRNTLLLLLSTEELFISLLTPVFLPEEIMVRTGAIVAPVAPVRGETPGVLFCG